MALFAADIEMSDDQERRSEVRPTHREYLASLLEAGKLHESGPYVDGSGALIIYIADDVAEVQEILSADPYAKAGLIVNTKIKEWNPVISKFA
ncbi:MAG: YciI family protein [Thermomicrobiales bacterium]